MKAPGIAAWKLSALRLPANLKSQLTNRTESSTEEKPTLTIMDTTQAYFLENANAGHIFVIEGTVVNESARPVSFVLLEGKLYYSDNRVAQIQRCFCSNPLRRDQLIKFSTVQIQDRMMNREGDNLSNLRILPKARVPFMLIFYNLPELEGLGDYSFEVISAKLE